MIRKIIGAVLAALGAAIAIVLFTGGGPLLPHIVGPVVLIAAGAVLILIKGAARQSPEA